MAKQARKAPARKPAKKAAKKTPSARPPAKAKTRVAASKSLVKSTTKTKAVAKAKVLAKTRPSEKIASRSSISISSKSVKAVIKPSQSRPTSSKTTSGKAAREKKMTTIDVENYLPSDKETFMDERQREYFRRKLITWKDDIIRESRDTLTALQTENENHPDVADRASSETDRAIELRARDRQRKLISKIDSALGRIEDGSYGYCEETGEPIALKRLDARPIATLSIEAQERHERRERVYRDD
jgi:DnaK suppressor protein